MNNPTEKVTFVIDLKAPATGVKFDCGMWMVEHAEGPSRGNQLTL